MNLIEPSLAFLEGLALIASPCILPVLPLVLSASVEGGRRRPFGIIIGFVLAFSVFALASRKLVNVLGIDLDIIQNTSLILLALLGCVMLSAKLSEKFSSFTQGAANLGSKFSANNKGGLASGIFIGALIGLIWTPCAGPILAAVLVQVIRQESDLASLSIILPFAIGAGIPMLIIALAGRNIMNKLSFFSTHAEAVRKIFGMIILLGVAFIASGIDITRLFDNKDETIVALNTNSLQEGLEKPYLAPEFTGIESWLNSEPLTMQSLKGKVVLIDFWTYSCINCIRTFPYITAWDKKYRDKGLMIIGIHAPEFEFEKNVDNVKAALAQYDIKYPVALDNKLDTWTNFKNRYWPAHYLINRDGQVVYIHFGEGHYAQTENNIRYLLGLDKTTETAAETPAFSEHQTAETYLGYDRAANFASREPIAGDMKQRYDFPVKLKPDHWALEGDWKIEKERIVSAEAGAKLRLHFNAKKVFLVLGGSEKTATIELNGKPVGTQAGSDAPEGSVIINQHRLYHVINQENVQQGIIEITAGSSGLEAYAFTFGN